MSDFTKEELKLLLAGLSLWMEDIHYETELNREFRNNLYKKLDAIIDNYCDHDYRSVGNHPWLHCVKCKRNFNFTETQIC